VSESASTLGRIPQVPVTQASPPAHGLSHMPQLSRFDVMSTQLAPQSVVPPGQRTTHAPALQTSPIAVLQAPPQLPQFAGSTSVSTQRPPHASVPTPQPLAHAPELQTSPAPQIVPHPPQFMGSKRVSVHAPPHTGSAPQPPPPPPSVPTPPKSTPPKSTPPVPPSPLVLRSESLQPVTSAIPSTIPRHTTLLILIEASIYISGE